MGFRNPMSLRHLIADGVQAGPDGGPSVTIAKDPVSGLYDLELWAGYANETPTRLVRRRQFNGSETQLGGGTTSVADRQEALLFLRSLPDNSSEAELDASNTNFTGSASAGAQGSAADHLTRRDFVESIRTGVVLGTGGYSVGWVPWADGIYQDLAFDISRDGIVTVSGVCKFTAATGATSQICPLTGDYRPRDGLRHIVPVNISDGTTARFANIQASGIFLRGALPATNQFVAFNASYPGATA